MKKVVLFFFLFTSVLANSQIYSFTTYISYKVPYGDSAYDKNYIYNINEDDYYLTFRTVSHKIEAVLRDEKNKVMHIFDVKQIDNKIVSEFEYRHSKKMTNDFSDCFFDYEETKYQDSLTKINVKIFRTKKKKKTRFTAQLIGKKSEFNHFLFFRKMHFHGYGYSKNLLLKNDIIVTKYGDGKLATTLNEIREINIKITIDKIVLIK